MNYHVNLQGQYLFTNAPYHWRGDRPTFNSFNPAFVGLLGLPAQLTAAEMQQYTDFINTVRHPGNPEQALDRRVPGTLDPINPDDWQTATGPKLGLQIYHNVVTDGFGSCAGCHALPEGSDNVVTEAFTVEQTITGGPAQFQPFETAQLRNLVPREMWLHRLPGVQDPLTALANTGTFHNGNPVAGSINLFNQTFFSTTVPGTTPAEQQTNLEALTAFTRQFDWGTSSIVGIPFTIDESQINVGTGSLGGNQVAFDVLRDSVEEVNSGGIATVRQGQVYRGFWLDTTASGWREEGTATILSDLALASLAIGVDNEVVLQATPLGSARRMANLKGVATQLSGPAPANILPEAMAPMTYYTDIPQFQQFLQVDQTVTPPLVLANTITSMWALRTLQLSVLGNFGVTTLNHTPPRRFRVVGDNIRPGAKLLIGIPNATPGAFPVDILQLDVFPTNRFNSSGQRIWESEEELAPILTYLMLNGGPYAPDTVNVAQRTTTTPSLQPLVWNSFAWAILNEDGTLNSTFNFAPITVQDVR